tara:strand:+ start:116 stop:715 length:600 start_codon:yes stop_codon:yes gene_type:complete
MAKVELDQVFVYRDNKDKFKTKTRKCTIHSELISFVGRYFDVRDREFKKDIFVLNFYSFFGPITVKSDYNALLSIMNDDAYFVVIDGSGGTIGNNDTGGGYSGSGTGTAGTCTAYKSTAITNFNGACQGTLNQTYYHNGSGSLPVVGNRVYSNSGCTLTLPDGYYGIGPQSVSVPTDFIRVTNSYVLSVTQCIEQVPEP